MSDVNTVIALAGFVIGLVSVVVLFLQTRNLTEAYHAFIDNVTRNAEVTEVARDQYSHLTNEQKEYVDLAFDLISTLSSITPDEKDDVFEEWVNKVRTKVQE